MSPDPYIWLQENEASGRADCGCTLNRTGPTGDGDPIFYQCAMHDAAPELLEALQGIFAHAAARIAGTYKGQPLLDNARAAIAKATTKKGA